MCPLSPSRPGWLTGLCWLALCTGALAGPRLQALPEAGALALEWPGAPGWNYRLETRAEATAGDWTAVAGTARLATGWQPQNHRESLVAAPDTHRFFRVAASPAAAWDDEFHGPLPGWLNVRTLGATGDGLTDDTAALKAAIGRLGSERTNVLYFPAGTYRITETLEFPAYEAGRPAEHQTLPNKLIYGEHPTNTFLRWDGPTNGVMTRLQGVHSFTIGRLTLDGAGRARVCLRIERDPRLGMYSSYGRVEDMIFRGAGYGLYNTDWDTAKNDMDAEYSVLRCQFLGLTGAGVRIEPGNGFDYWIRHCRFERCRIGVLNDNGDFRAHGCVFLDSAVADLQVKGHRNGGIRGNYSRGSRRFATLTSSYVTVDQNRIIDPVETAAIQIETSWGTLLLDNEIRSRRDAPAGPVIREGAIKGKGPVTVIGNRFTQPGNVILLRQTNSIQQDNVTVDHAAVDDTEPVLPACPPRVERRVLTFSNASQLQSVVNQAAGLITNGTEAVVVIHVRPLTPEATKLPRTVVVPGGLPIYFEGDGPLSRLRWGGAANDPAPLLRLASPSRAVLRNLELFTLERRGAPNLEIVSDDQPGSVVWGDNFAGNLAAERLVNTRVDLTDFYGGHVHVTGADQPGPARVAVFAGSGSGESAMVRVADGGRVFVSDVWFEGGLKEPWLVAKGGGSQPGEVTLQGCFIFQPEGERFPTLLADGFAGRLAVMAGRTVGASLFTNDVSGLDYASLMGHAPVLTNSTAPRTKFLIEGDPPDLATIVPPHQRWLPEGITGYDPALLRRLLEFSRATRPAHWSLPTDPARTAVRLHRVNASVRVVPAAAN